MKIEDQIVSIDLAEKLKKLNVEQNSYFYYEIYPNDSFEVNYHTLCRSYTTKYSAYTSDEILLMLPRNKDVYYLYTQKSDLGYVVFYAYIQCENLFKIYNDLLFDNKKLSDSLAEMLIHLIEYNLIELNKN